MPKAARPQTMMWHTRNVGKSDYEAHVDRVLEDTGDEHEAALVTKPVLPKDVKALFKRMGIKPKRSRKK